MNTHLEAKTILSSIAVAAIMVTSTWGQSIVITSFQRDGILQWQDPDYTNRTYAVEWSPNLAPGSWSRTWDPLTLISSSTATTTVTVPMFYRVVGFPSGNAPIRLDGLSIRYYETGVSKALNALSFFGPTNGVSTWMRHLQYQGNSYAYLKIGSFVWNRSDQDTNQGQLQAQYVTQYIEGAGLDLGGSITNVALLVGVAQTFKIDSKLVFTSSNAGVFTNVYSNTDGTVSTNTGTFSIL